MTDNEAGLAFFHGDELRYQTVPRKVSAHFYPVDAELKVAVQQTIRCVPDLQINTYLGVFL